MHAATLRRLIYPLVISLNAPFLSAIFLSSAEGCPKSATANPSLQQRPTEDLPSTGCPGLAVFLSLLQKEFSRAGARAPSKLPLETRLI